MSRRNQKLSTLCKDAGPHERRPSLMSIEQPEWNVLAVRVGQQEPVFTSFHGDHWLRLLEASLSKSSAAVSSSSSFVGLSFEAMDGLLSLEAQVKLVSGSCFSPWMSCVLSAWEASKRHHRSLQIQRCRCRPLAKRRRLQVPGVRPG